MSTMPPPSGPVHCNPPAQGERGNLRSPALKPPLPNGFPGRPVRPLSTGPPKRSSVSTSPPQLEWPLKRRAKHHRAVHCHPRLLGPSAREPPRSLSRTARPATCFAHVNPPAPYTSCPTAPQALHAYPPPLPSLPPPPPFPTPPPTSSPPPLQSSIPSPPLPFPFPPVNCPVPSWCRCPVHLLPFSCTLLSTVPPVPSPSLSCPPLLPLHRPRPSCPRSPCPLPPLSPPPLLSTLPPPPPVHFPPPSPSASSLPPFPPPSPPFSSPLHLLPSVPFPFLPP
ncbi:hypothetical protein FKM82_026894 [Ascaphus truei]